MTTKPLDNLTLAVNHAMSEASIVAARNGLIGGQRAVDEKRSNAWCEYGFPAVVTDDMLFGLYRRGGLAHGAVVKVSGKCWESNPELVQGDEDDDSRDETPWEKKTAKVFNRRLWRAIAECDRRRLAMRYSALILHFSDNEDWDKPVNKSASLRLVKVTPAWSVSMEVAAYQEDATKPDYGQPTMWTYKQMGVGKNAKEIQVKVHPDRLFIFGDASAGAIAWLEPAYNAFVSIEKIEGGSGEAYLKNAARQIAVEFDKEIDFNNLAAMYGVNVDQLQERFNEAAKALNRGIDTMLPLQGAKASTLVANAPDPTQPYEVNLKTACAALNIETMVLTGEQSGERASTQNAKSFAKTCQSRREDLSFEIEDFARKLQGFRVIDAADDFTVVWDDLTESSTAEKLANAKLMSDINAEAIKTGDSIFTDSEIRVAADYSPQKEEVTDGTDDDEDQDPKTPDPAAQPV